MNANINLVRRNHRVVEGSCYSGGILPLATPRWKRDFVFCILSVGAFVASCFSSFGQSTPVNLIPANTPSALTYVGHGYGTGQIKAMTGSDCYGGPYQADDYAFTQGWEIAITGNPTVRNTVTLGAGTSGSTAVAKGDLIVATFYYRRVDTATDEANFSLRVQETSSYTPALDIPIRGRSYWRRMSVPFTAVVDATAAQGFAMIFEMGTQNQTIDIAGVKLVDYGQCSLFGANNIDAAASQSFGFYFVDGSGTTCGSQSVVAGGPNGYTNCNQFNVTHLPSDGGWRVRMDGSVPGTINAGDNLVAICWMRSSYLPAGTYYGAGALGFIGNNGKISNEFGTGHMMVDGSWKQWIFPFKAYGAHAANTLNYQIQAGNEVQGLQVAGIQLLDLGKTQIDSHTANNLTGTLYDYPGREMGNQWRTDANTRIAANRQGPINFKVTDGSGNSVAGTTVTANLKRNAFNFGAQASVSAIQATNNTAWKQKLLDLVNSAEIGSYYDGFWDDTRGGTWPEQQREGMNATMNWFRLHGVTSLRAHALLFLDYGGVVGTAAGQSPTTLESKINFHITDEGACTDNATATKSYLPMWDFINEPWDKEDIENGIAGAPLIPPTQGPGEANNQCIAYADRDAGPNYIGGWLATMHSATTGDPFAKAFVNDYLLIDGYPELFPKGVDPHRDYDLELVKSLGAQLDGIGFESHLNESFMPPLNAKAVLDSYVTASSKIKEEVTEYDQIVPGVDQANGVYGLSYQGNGAVPADVLSESVYGQYQADCLADYLTLMFSEPNTDFFDLWGVGEGTDHKGLIYTSTLQPKLTFEAWDSLTSVTHGRWTTVNQSATSTTGTVAIPHCYLGRYELTANGNGVTKNFFVDLPTTSGVTVNLQNTGVTNTNVWLYEAERDANAVYSPLVKGSDVNASGGSYVWDDPATGTVQDNPDLPEMRVDTEATGSVYIWVRIYATDGNHDSYWMAIDNGPWQVYALHAVNSWVWCRFSATATNLAANTDYTGNHTGHTLYFCHRETGAKLDQVLITDDATYTPH